MSLLTFGTTLYRLKVCTFSRLGAIESISSINIIDGEFFSASSNALRRLLSDSPAILLMISGPLMRKKKAPVSLATARAISVLPVPGGPYSKIPRGGWRRRRRKEGKVEMREKETVSGRREKK